MVLSMASSSSCSSNIQIKSGSIDGDVLWERRQKITHQTSCPHVSRWLRRGNQHIGNDDLIVFRCKLDIMKRYETEVAETLQYMVSPQGRNTWTVDDFVPYVDKIIILSEEQERITECVSHGPAPEHEFAPQEFHILSSSVETQGIGR
ncbi:hypothetical protein HKD37_18G050174 [Glycine soja]